MNHSDVLQKVYKNALSETAEDNYTSLLSEETENQISMIVNRSEANKGLITVLITLLTHKIVGEGA